MENPQIHRSAGIVTSDRVCVCVCLCVRAGGGEEQAAAATLFVLLCVQLGGGDEAEECFKMLRPLFSAILIDRGASVSARQSVSGQPDTWETPGTGR